MSEIKVNSIKGVAASTAALTINNTDGTCTANITNNLSNRNKIINGSAMLNQRGNATGVNSQGYYGPDRYKWIQNSSSAAFSINRSGETPDGFANSYHVECTTADTSVAADSYIRFLTALEGKDVQDFAKGTSSAKKAVLSFYVKTNVTGTYSVLYFDSDNNRQFNGTYTVTNTNWNRYTIPIPADTTGAFNNDNGPSLEIYWGLVGGSNLTGSVDTVWQSYTAAKEMAGHTVNFASSTSNNFYITGIQLEVDQTESGVATDFEHRSFGQELALCQRYFQKSFGAEIDPAVSVSKCIYSFTRPYTSGYHEALGNDYVVEMRAQPSVAFYPIQGSGSVGQVSYYDSGWSNTSASYHTGHSTSKRLVFSINTSSSTTLVQYNYTLDAEL